MGHVGTNVRGLVSTNKCLHRGSESDSRCQRPIVSVRNLHPRRLEFDSEFTRAVGPSFCATRRRVSTRCCFSLPDLFHTAQKKKYYVLVLQSTVRYLYILSQLQVLDCETWSRRETSVVACSRSMSRSSS